MPATPLLTPKQATVLSELKLSYRRWSPDAVPTFILKMRVNNMGVSYDAADRALKALLELGLVERPKRGYWRPA